MIEKDPAILIVGPAWVGDMVMAQSLFKYLRQQFPDARLDILAPAWTRPLLDRMPEVNDALIMPLGHGHFQFFARRNLGLEIRNHGEKYTHAIVLPSSFKSALVPFFANIKQRIGFLGEMRWGLLNDARRIDKKILPRTVDRFVSLGDLKGRSTGKIHIYNDTLQPSLEINQKNVESALKQFNIPDSKSPVLGLCPGAEYGPAKQWPAGYYADIARQKLSQGWQVWLFGSDKDRAVTSEINKLTQNQCLDFGGKTSLANAIDLMSCTDTIVSNDSGLMHVAAALGKKLIALYGSSDPGFTPPLTGKAKVLTLDLDCSPCFKRNCPLGHTNCLVQLKPDQVLNALDS